MTTNPPLPDIGQMEWGTQLNAVLADLQERMTALEGGAPPITIDAPTVTGITPTSGKNNTSVTITGSGFNTFGAYQAALGSVGNWFVMIDFLVVNDNTITADTVPTTDGPGAYQLAVYFNTIEAVILPNAFTYT